ncbi:DUF4331 domain-containing protein [Thiosocius teredinicola]|uniref:DUF4331 domain-containing protein n=1 Tax=Thiosocius teredinicola TaxID=1973002 RepID=UPI0009913F1D
MSLLRHIVGTTLSASIALLSSQIAGAASHSDAPLIKQDPQANLTDVYAFIGRRYDDPTQQVLNVIANVRPFSEPGDGVIYDRFADDARYSIHIADPTTGDTVTRYDFQFSSVTDGYKRDNTILAYGTGDETGPIDTVGGARQNYTQTYRVTKVSNSQSQEIASGLLTPPPNVGANTTPDYNDEDGRAVSGARFLSELDSYTRQTLFGTSTGEAVFAGPREDGFYADTPAIFDLLDGRIIDNNGDPTDGLGQDGNGVDGFKGFNVLTYAVQIPLSELQPKRYTAAFADLLGQALPAAADATGVGVYASVSRQRIRILRSDRKAVNSGPWVQVNRMGNPLFNEVLVSIADKDNFNRTSPQNDAAQFGIYADSPELATLLNLVFGTTIQDSGRSDLSLVFLPDVLRVDTTTGPVTLAGDPQFHRLGFIGGDIAVSDEGRAKSSGWPNGRRLGDDVVDIALTALASGPTYATPTVVGDNIDTNDQLYNQVFPYAATPHAGPTNRKDP